MSTLIRNGAVSADEWQSLGDDEAITPCAKVIVSLQRWRADAQSLKQQAAQVGLRLENTVDLDELRSELEGLALVALEFPLFSDGRALSQARVLREQLGFAGEIRATGAVLRDQMFYMQRCGFNAFEVPDGRDVAGALAALREFSVKYQAAADSSQTIFAQRAASS